MLNISDTVRTDTMTQSTIAISPTATVALRDITEATLRSILRLKVAPKQEKFVANNAVSIAQAHFSKYAWFRAIYADETPVGFIMLHDEPEKPFYYLWRLMIDTRYQQMGFGRQALACLIEHVKTRPQATELYVSYVPGAGSAQGFYERIGFEHTGEEDGGERVMKLPL